MLLNWFEYMHLGGSKDEKRMGSNSFSEEGSTFKNGGGGTEQRTGVGKNEDLGGFLSIAKLENFPWVSKRKGRRSKTCRFTSIIEFP